MCAKWKTTKNDFPRMKKSLESLNGKKINVGVLEGEHAWLASIHEYGCKIPVTPKMRAWFAYQGFPLKKTTTVITIPERSFLRTGFDTHNKEVVEKVEQTMPDVLVGTLSVEKYCEIIGLLLASKIKDYARDLKNPPNSTMTTQMKGSSNPLVDTGSMIEGITYEVE